MAVSVKSARPAPVRSRGKVLPDNGVGHLTEADLAEAGLSERLRVMRIEVEELLQKAKQTRASLG